MSHNLFPLALRLEQLQRQLGCSLASLVPAPKASASGRASLPHPDSEQNAIGHWPARGGREKLPYLLNNVTTFDVLLSIIGVT